MFNLVEWLVIYSCSVTVLDHIYIFDTFREEIFDRAK